MREKIKQLKGKGFSNKEIAKKLNLCASTITYHLQDEYRQRHYNNLKKRRKENKKNSVQYKGGKCIFCNYNRCISALEFHHLDPSKKDFNITNNLQKTFEETKRELDKCILLCSNCHRELHAGIIKLEARLGI